MAIFDFQRWLVIPDPAPQFFAGPAPLTPTPPKATRKAKAKAKAKSKANTKYCGPANGKAEVINVDGGKRGKDKGKAKKRDGGRGNGDKCTEVEKARRQVQRSRSRRISYGHQMLGRRHAATPGLGR